MANPLDSEALKYTQFITGKNTEIAAISTMSEIKSAIARRYSSEDLLTAVMEDIKEPTDTRRFHIESITKELEMEVDLFHIEKESSRLPIIKMINGVVMRGIERGASDIHIEPSENMVQVRYRIDGILHSVMQIPGDMQGRIISRLKVVGGLDIAERRVPQDGRFTAYYEDKAIDIRVSSLPTYYGEKIVLRLLYPSQAFTSLQKLGLSDSDMRKVMTAIKKPQGFILLTGPTGSGKTTTLYAMLMEVRNPEINIVTIEDPIEYNLPGINQVQINEKVGLNFANILRSVLRQDPDVIMVGEIRDLTTARIALQASMTGHLVLSTLHTNDTASAVTRLIDLGIEPFLISSPLELVIAQRLLRQNCGQCSESYIPSEKILAQLGIKKKGIKFYRGRGCPACSNIGVTGRTGVFEVMPITPHIKELISQRASESLIRKDALHEGMRALLDDIIDKIEIGISTPEEALRIIAMGLTSPEEIAKAVAINEQRIILCSICGVEIPPSSSICPHCGSDIKKI